MSCCFILVPYGAPRNVTGYNISSSSIMLTWYDVKEDLRNGEITGYLIYFHPKDDSSSVDTKDVLMSTLTPGALPMTCIVTGLSIYTEYNMTILAYNGAGSGIEVSTKFIFTDSESKFYSVSEYFES